MRYIYSEERLPIPENGEQAIRPLLFEVIGRKDAGAEWETSSGALGVLGRCSRQSGYRNCLQGRPLLRLVEEEEMRE